MAAKHDPIDLAAERFKAEISKDAKANAKGLFGDRPHGTTDLSEPELIAMIQRNANDPNFLTARLQQVGPVEFLREWHAAMAPEQQMALAQKIAQTGGGPQ